MSLSTQDVHDKQFKLVRQTTGYDMDEVDAFLDEVEAEISRLNQLVVEQQEALEAAQRAPVAQVSAPDAETPVAGAARILELAQVTADQHVAEAQARGEAMVNDAQQRAQDAKDTIDGQRMEIERRIEDLRIIEGDIRIRLRTYLEKQLAEIERGTQAGSEPLALAAGAGEAW